MDRADIAALLSASDEFCRTAGELTALIISLPGLDAARGWSLDDLRAAGELFEGVVVALAGTTPAALDDDVNALFGVADIWLHTDGAPEDSTPKLAMAMRAATAIQRYAADRCVDPAAPPACRSLAALSVELGSTEEGAVRRLPALVASARIDAPEDLDALLGTLGAAVEPPDLEDPLIDPVERAARLTSWLRGSAYVAPTTAMLGDWYATNC